jgi:hypothetical protein
MSFGCGTCALVTPMSAHVDSQRSGQVASTLGAWVWDISSYLFALAVADQIDPLLQ